MAYTPTDWKNLPNTSSALCKNNLNKIEQQLVDVDILNLSQKPAIATGDDLNDYIIPGIYTSTSASITDTLTNCPYTGAGFKLIVEKVHGDQRYRQTLHTNTPRAETYVRMYTGSWGEWQQVIMSPLSERNVGALTSNVGHFQSDSYNWCRRSGNVVSFFISLIIDTAVTSGWTQAIANFPEGFRPKSYTLMTMSVGNQGGTANNYKNVVVAVNTNGNLNGEWDLAVGDKIQLGGCFII